MNPNWAEQLEALSTFAGALLATGAIIFAWLSYRKDREKQQEQINEIVSFTDALKKQTYALEVKNENDSKLLESILLNSKRDTDNAEIENARYKKKIQPNFRYEMGGSSINQYSVKLKNIGGLAIFQKYDGKIPEELLFEISADEHKQILPNEAVYIIINRSSYKGAFSKFSGSLKIYYFDITEKNLYMQNIEVTNGITKVSYPIEQTILQT